MEGLYYPYSENKGADQLRGYREADLRLCFRICKKPVFSRRGSYVFTSARKDVHLHMMICAFVYGSLDSIISRPLQASAVEQAGLCQTQLEILKSGFLVSKVLITLNTDLLEY